MRRTNGQGCRLLSDLWTLSRGNEARITGNRFPTAEKAKKTKNQLTGRPWRAINAGVMMKLNLRLLLGALLLGRAAVEV